MFDSIFPKSTLQRLLAALALTGLLATPPVQAQPSQTPLLASQSGAKPNLMISLDNSGSMSFSYHETYGVLTDSNNEFELKKCRANHWSELTGSWVLGGTADFYNNNRCILQNSNGTYSYTNLSDPYTPPRKVSGAWSSQRSADVNPVYYNPRTTYAPRVSASGAALVPQDGVAWISNQASTGFRYTVYRNGNEIRTHHSMYAANPSVTGYNSIYDISSAVRIPQHITYSSTTTTTPGFTYSYCSNVITHDGLQWGCAPGAWTDVTVRRNVSGNVTLPAGHSRTDCAGNANANTCSNAQEVANIMNWYRYYAFRAPAVATAIGQAIANTNYNRNLRLGYLSINRRNNSTISAIDQTPGVTTDNLSLLRGVRPHELGTADTQRIYTWLYDQDGTQNRNSNNGADAAFNATGNRSNAPYGGTPLHNAVAKVASYYSVGTGATENPWSTNPGAAASTTNPEMSCRRSFNLLFSDGAWNSGTSNISGTDYDNTDGPSFSRTLIDNTVESFQYLRNGVNTVAGRRAYTPFPSTGTGGLADLTANYFWHLDLRQDLANNVQTRAGQPTFWQNMTTYTVGYLIRPSGEVPGASSGLTFDQIKTYQSQYATSGYAAATKPSWATGNLDNSGTDQDRVNDFIQAGYTGGGKGFSARSADDVRSIFDTIISEILSSSGRDAGVAVSGGSDLSTIAGSLKYSVSYRTLDNSGEISAQELDANGNVVSTRWNASDLIGAADTRNVFTITGDTTPRSFSGALNALPADVQAALKPASVPAASRIPTDARFINYLRGLDPVTDAQGVLFRQRSSKLGAMVNPPSIFMGGDRDFAYDLSSTVDGKASYLAFADAKRSLPASLFVATNAGMMHALNAQTGRELAAYMPRRSLRRMLNYANADYNFEYTLDGPLSEHDIYDGTRWNHMAVGTGGRGEPLVYAVRSPLNTATPANRTPGQADFMWESGPDRINDADVSMGYITNPLRSGQTASGDWIVVANNGHYNGLTNGSKAGLVILNAMTGAKLRTIPLPSAYSAGRGLSGVTLVRNANKRIVAAYAGDANGNLWRFDLKGAPATWAVSYGRPIFTTANHRPIYGSPAWQAHPEGGTIVVVATGMLLADSDLGDTATNEAIYGIWDPTHIGSADVTPFTTVVPSELLQQTVLQGTAQVVGGTTYFQATRNAIDWAVHRGWTMPLGRTHLGERSIDQIRNLGTSVLITTTVLSQPANPQAEMCTVSNLPANYIYALNAINGASTRSFDINNDGRLDNVSVVLVSGGGYARGMSVADIIRSTSLTDSLRQRFAPDSSSGESDPESKPCTPLIAKLIGTESGALTAGVACEVPGWSRSQYQLSRPPSN